MQPADRIDATDTLTKFLREQYAWFLVGCSMCGIGRHLITTAFVEIFVAHTTQKLCALMGWIIKDKMKIFGAFLSIF